jgi:hypothetical protein
VSLVGFWAVVFFSAFAAFVAVSALIAVKGTGEIRELFRHLDPGRDADGRRRPPEDR